MVRPLFHAAGCSRRRGLDRAPAQASTFVLGPAVHAANAMADKSRRLVVDQADQSEHQHEGVCGALE